MATSDEAQEAISSWNGRSFGGRNLTVNEAIDKADANGIDDTLVLTKDAALIVNVKNRTVITAMDRAQMTGNVFTNIDGAVII